MAAGYVFRRATFYVWLAIWLCDTICHPEQLKAMTLWLNMQFLLYLSIDLTSATEVALLHTASWGSMHALGPGYLVLLWFVPGHFRGLDGEQMERWCAARAGPLDCVPHMALIRSFVLHFLPAILLHIDLRLNMATLRATHARLAHPLVRFWIVFLAPAWLGLFQKEVALPGLWKTQYGVPSEHLGTFDLFTNVVGIPCTYCAVWWLRSLVLPPVPATKRAKKTK